MKINSIVKPNFRGEDERGRIIDWTQARFRVISLEGCRIDHIILEPINLCAKDLGSGEYHKGSIEVA